MKSKLSRLVSFSSAIEAEMVKNYLLDEGIESALYNYNQTRMHIPAAGISKIELMVHRLDLDIASDLLKEFRGELRSMVTEPGLDPEELAYQKEHQEMKATALCKL